MKNQDKKQHFDDIYIQTSPVGYKERILDDLEYISDNFNKETFDRLILPQLSQLIDKSQEKKSDKIRYMDICSCFGNTSLATLYGMDYDSIRENWKDETSCCSIQSDRRFPSYSTGVDISQNALTYAKSVGIFDEIMPMDLNNKDSKEYSKLDSILPETDIVICTAGLVYLDIVAIERIVQNFASSLNMGFMLVNFLNPFSPEKSDETKKILLKHLDFVGSRASRHRKLSPLERENYPGEEWSLLEIWVLERKKKVS